MGVWTHIKIKLEYFNYSMKDSYSRVESPISSYLLTCLVTGVYNPNRSNHLESFLE